MNGIQAPAWTPPPGGFWPLRSGCKDDPKTAPNKPRHKFKKHETIEGVLVCGRCDMQIRARLLPGGQLPLSSRLPGLPDSDTETPRSEENPDACSPSGATAS